MKVICTIAFLFVLLGTQAQDTIVYKNGLKTPVVLKEISPAEIRYQRFGMTGGPDYVISKADVDRVIYKNGITETFQAAPPAPVNPPASIQAQGPQPAIVVPYTGKIECHMAKKNYRSLKELALTHPDVKRQPQLVELALDIRQHKNAQDGTRTGAIVCGGLAIGGTFLYALSYALSNNSEPVFYVPPAILGGLAVGLGSISIVYNVKLRDKRKEFVDLYNE